MTLDEILELLDGVHRSGRGYVARCPSHDDRNPSLSIGLGDDERILIKCHAGCASGDIAKALGISLRDFFPESEEEIPNNVPVTFNYTDEGGDLLFQVCRFPGKQFRQRRPDGKGGWIWKLGDVRRVLYRLPRLLAAEVDEVCFVVEGEKDVESLRKIELVATCNVGGAGKWRDEYSEFLRGRDVVILPDNDEPGMEHAQKVAQSLSEIALRVRLLVLPGLSNKGDVSDWLFAGHTREELLHLVSLCGEWDPNAKTPNDSRITFVSVPERIVGEREERLRIGPQIVPFGVSYLDDCCRGILPTDLLLIGGPSGSGKTAFATAIAQQAAEKGLRVYFFALEAEPREIERRAKYRYLATRIYALKVSGAERLNYLDWYIGRCDDICAPYEAEADAEVVRRYKTLKTYYRVAERFDNDRLNRLLDEIRGEADLVVLDHIHYVDEDSGENENESIKRTVKILRDSALACGKPVAVVAHLRKAERGRPRLVAGLDDFHGSSNIIKIATRVVTIAPARGQPAPLPWMVPTYLAVIKDRPGGVQGHVAVSHFDLSTFSYSNDYRLGRLSFTGDEWEEMTGPDLPRWAKRAVGYGVRP